MSVIVASLQGRFGNACMQYLFCRALAEYTRSELRVEPWLGERVFQIDHLRPDPANPVVRMNAIEALQWSLLPSDKRCDIEVRDYCQHQPCMRYSKREAQAWLTLRPEIAVACAGVRFHNIVGHHRNGDYIGYGYPVVRRDSYPDACLYFGLDPVKLIVLSEETAEAPSALHPDLSFVADFYRMLRAPTLLRGNSTFSWLAGLLSNGLVLSPVIDGLEGGREHHCQFVAGNHPRLANFDFTTDLYVSP